MPLDNQIFELVVRIHGWPVDQQNVEQYLYLSMFPEGNNTRDIFRSIKELDWIIAKDTEYVEDNFDQYLLSNNEKLYVMIRIL